jgi:hypothetical protein
MTTGALAITEARNVSGPLRLYIFRDGTWVFLNQITSPNGKFTFSVDFAIGVYQMKVVYEGSPTAEPCEIIFSVAVTPNYNILILVLGIPIGAVALVSSYIVLDKRLRIRHVKQAKVQAELEADQEKRMRARQLYHKAGKALREASERATRDLYNQTDIALTTGIPLEEPEVLTEQKSKRPPLQEPLTPSDNINNLIKDLTRIPQMTSALAHQLIAIGIQSVEALAQSDPETISSKLNLYPKFTRKLIENARTQLTK